MGQDTKNWSKRDYANAGYDFNPELGKWESPEEKHARLAPYLTKNPPTDLSADIEADKGPEFSNKNPIAGLKSLRELPLPNSTAKLKSAEDSIRDATNYSGYAFGGEIRKQALKRLRGY